MRGNDTCVHTLTHSHSLKLNDTDTSLRIMSSHMSLQVPGKCDRRELPNVVRQRIVEGRCPYGKTAFSHFGPGARYEQVTVLSGGSTVHIAHIPEHAGERIGFSRMKNLAREGEGMVPA